MKRWTEEFIEFVLVAAAVGAFGLILVALASTVYFIVQVVRYM
jgi:uncharacterized membrane protein